MDEQKEYYALIKKMFKIWAPFYDAFSLPIACLRNKVVDFTKARAGAKILDVASGTGKQAFAFAKKGYDVTGVDLSEDMLRVAKRNNKYQNIKFEIADATCLRFENNSFDVSSISFALHDMPLAIREKVLKEMVRVTKQDGAIIVVDYALPQNKLSRFLVYNLIRIYERLYYSEFITSDLGSLLEKSGIQIKEEVSVMLGAGRIIKGMKR